MRKTIRKLFWGWDFDKEEKWLNEMSAKGLCLVSVGFCQYDFEPCLPGEYTIRMEFLEKLPGNPESEQYIKFIEDTGAQQVGSYGKWVYFRKNTADGDFELFSDNSSRINHLKRILLFVGLICGLNLYFAAYNFYLFAVCGNEISLLGALNLLLAVLSAYGFRRLNKKRKRLQAERQIYE